MSRNILLTPTLCSIIFVVSRGKGTTNCRAYTIPDDIELVLIICVTNNTPYKLTSLLVNKHSIFSNFIALWKIWNCLFHQLFIMCSLVNQSMLTNLLQTSLIYCRIFSNKDLLVPLLCIINRLFDLFHFHIVPTCYIQLLSSCSSIDLVLLITLFYGISMPTNGI